VYRDFFTAEDDRSRRIAVTTGVLAIALSATLFAGFGQLLAPALARGLTGDRATTSLVRLEFLTAAMASVNSLLLMVLQSAREVRTVSLLTTVKLLFLVAFNLWLVVSLRAGLWGACLANFAGEACFLVLVVGTARRYAGREWSPRRLIPMLRYGLPFVPTRLMGVGTGLISTFMVGRLLGMHEAGLYNMAGRFAQPLALALSAFTSAWSTLKFKARVEYERPAEFFSVATTLATAIFVSLWVGIALWGPEALRALATPTFHPAAGLIAFVALAYVPQALIQLLGTGVELLDDTRRVPLPSLWSLIMAVTLLSILVPRLGAVGAALATTLAHSTLAFGNYWISRRGYTIVFNWRALAGLLGTGLAVGAGAVAIQGLALGPRLTAAAALTLVYPTAAFALLWMSPDRARILSFWRRTSWGALARP
jgi:O-antigen/teichoic acid export membrane protein